jgi:TrmH RNA methyltransferase
MAKTYSRRSQPRMDSKRLLRISGLPAVSALFARAAARVEQLFFAEELKSSVGPICAVLARSRKPYRIADSEELARVAGSIMHGGIVALAQPRPLPDVDPGSPGIWARHDGLLLLLDGVSNPHNLGALARTAAFFGLPKIVLSDHPGQALPSAASYRVAEGGLEYVDLYRAPRFAELLRTLRLSHLVVGTAAQGGHSIETLRRSQRPYALVLGNEEEGLPPATLKACDEIITISGVGSVQSLNVSASAAILIWALLRRGPTIRTPSISSMRNPDD